MAGKFKPSNPALSGAPTSAGVEAELDGPTGILTKRPPNSQNGGDDSKPEQGNSGYTIPGQSRSPNRSSRTVGGTSGKGEGAERNTPQGSSGYGIPGQTMRLTAEELDMSDDVAALFEGGEFSEEFRDRATTIFETAVVAKVNDLAEEIAAEMEEQLDEARQEMVVEFSAKLDKYLNYVVEQWMEENRLAVESGIKTELAESFLGSFKELIQEHHVDLPELSESEVVDQLSARIAELEANLNDAYEENVELAAIVDSIAKDEVFEEIVDGLSDAQIDKLQTLSEAITAEDLDDYREKLETIKESYFPTGGSRTYVRDEDDAFDEGELVDLNENGTVKVADPSVNRYVAAISRTAPKK